MRVTSGRATDVGTISLERGRSIGGTVSRDGNPVAGATVVVAREVSDSFYSFSERDRVLDALNGVHLMRSSTAGRFSFEGLGRGPWTVVADHPDFGRSTSVSIEAGDSDERVDLVLK